MVIRTPKCKTPINHLLADYDSENEQPLHRESEVSLYEKLVFIKAYSKKYKPKLTHFFKSAFSESETFEDGQDRFVELSTHTYPLILKEFPRLYKKYGEEWSDDIFKYENKKWWRYTTRNSNAKWDWWEPGGRYSKCLVCQDGLPHVKCKLFEIDWQPSDGFKVSSKLPTYALIIDGVWYEKESDEDPNWNEKFFNLIKNVPLQSEVTIVDFHE